MAQSAAGSVRVRCRRRTGLRSSRPKASPPTTATGHPTTANPTPTAEAEFRASRTHRRSRRGIPLPVPPRPPRMRASPLPATREKPMLTTTLATLAFLITPSAQAERPKLTDAKVQTADHVYKKTPQGELTLHGFFPTDWKATDKRPVIVFFFGGGWKNGAYTQFVPQAEYFASRGIVALS